MSTTEADILRAHLEIILHEAEKALYFKEQRAAGGQTVGTGGALGSCGPGALLFLQRTCLDALATSKDVK